MFVAGDPSSPVVTFTYLQGQEVHLTEFVRHLETYIPLFRQFLNFDFSIWRGSIPISKRPKNFSILWWRFRLARTCRRNCSATSKFARLGIWAATHRLSEADLIFRNQAKARFAGQRFEHLYRGWKVGRVTESDIRRDFAGSERHATVHFAAERLCRFAVSEQEPGGKN